jgi:thymidylate synthase
MISEPLVVSEDSITKAWRAASHALLVQGDRFNVTVHVRKPAAYDENEIKDLDPQAINGKVTSVFDVANTIFPRGRGHDADAPDAFCEHYRQIYGRGRSRKPTAWGTYFQRLVSFGADEEDQILKIIKCMNDWKARPRAAFVMHLSAANVDNPRPLGAPCWQYGQFIRTGDDDLSLSVMYRSHDYFQKALGNFLGLTRLLLFVCRHTKQTPGTLTCLSTYAYLGGSKAQTKALLAN